MSITYFQGTHVRKVFTSKQYVATAISLLKSCKYDIIKVEE